MSTALLAGHSPIKHAAATEKMGLFARPLISRMKRLLSRWKQGFNVRKPALYFFLATFLALAAGLLWAATTVYLKKYLSQRTVPLQTLFYQVFFSAPLLFLISVALEDPILSGFPFVTGLSVFYQCIIVAFISYLLWFELIHRYPVSLLHAFSFFTPVFGVFLSGILILGELVSLNLFLALALVSLGMILVNKRPRAKA